MEPVSGAESSSKYGLDFYEQLSQMTDVRGFQLRDIRPFKPRLSSKDSGTAHGATLIGEGDIEGLEEYLLHLIHMEESLRIENILINIPRKDAALQFTITVTRRMGGLS